MAEDEFVKKMSRVPGQNFDEGDEPEDGCLLQAMLLELPTQNAHETKQVGEFMPV